MVGNLNKSAVGSGSDPIEKVSTSKVPAVAEFTVQFIVSGKSLTSMLVAPIVARNDSWSSNGSIADIDDGILEETIFTPNGEELATAKSLTPSKRQGVRSVKSVGQGERSSRSGCTNSEAGNVVHCQTNKVRNVDGVSDLYMTKVSRSEVVVIVTTELESSRNSSTTSE